MKLPTVRDNNAQELRAFDEVCGRLGGFDHGIGFEWVDGFLTALAAGPQLPLAEEWLSAMCGDAFDRAFADPESHTSALRALKTRLAVLREQLNPEVLFDQPDELRLNPLISEWSETETATLVAAQGPGADGMAEMQTGAMWAVGFFDGVRAFPKLWPEPQDEESADYYAELWSQLKALVLPAGSPELAEHLAWMFPQDEPTPATGPTRDDLIVQASYAVQDLRMFWVDNAPRPETRRVDKAPGRNDPCPCGSGKKYKKCHGAAVA